MNYFHSSHFILVFYFLSLQQPPDPLGSLASFDSGTLDFLTQKNKERNKALRALERKSCE